MQTRRKPNFLVLLIVGLAFLLLLAGSISYILNLREQSEVRMSYYLQDATHQRKLALHRQIQNDLRLLESISAAIAAVSQQSEASLRALLLAANPDGAFLRIGIAGTDGRITMVSPDGQTHQTASLADEPFFQAALFGEHAISEVFLDETSGEYVAYCAVPVFEANRIAGVLCGIRSDRALRDIISAPITTQNGAFFIVDGAGTIIVPGLEPAAGLALGSNLFAIGEFTSEERDVFSEALLTQSTGRYTFSIGGVRQFATLEPLGINEWIVVSLIDHTAIDGYYNRSLWGAASIIIVSSLILLFLLYWQTRESRKNQSALEALAYNDALTGGWNFAKFQMEAKNILAENPALPCAVWTFDIKNFTLINDLFGSERGNQVLRRIHRVLSADAPEHAALCRIGSDMFAGIRPYGGRDEIRAWFWQVIAILSEREVIREDEMHITYAMGVYCIEDFAEEELTVTDMVNRASAARREAKAQVGNAFEFFTKEMQDLQKWTATLEASGKAALASGEITFFLQPKVSIREGYHLTGAEALARWNYPGHGWVPPDFFIPLFERSGFIVEVDRHIFHQVCLWYLAHKEAFAYTPRLAVNVSRQGLLRDDVVSYYAGLKERYGIADGILELEFTEGMVFNDRTRFRNVVSALKQHGFICTIDDFGSGYSSLNILRDLPIDALKLDAEFFRGGGNDQRDQIVIKNFIVMAQQLCIRTVAEGVEMADQVAFLQEIGCDVVQGFVFSRPLTQEAFQRMLEETGGILPLPAEA